MKSTSATSSITGSVLGMQTMVVTPPAAAARLAVASVSRCSSPGSPAETIMSMRPGASTRPPQSTTWASPIAPAATWRPKSAMRSSMIKSPPSWSRPEAGSMSRALTRAIWRGAGRGFGAFTAVLCWQMSGQGLKHRHADRDTHLDLLADHALRVVGDVRVDFDAPVHGTWMHDESVGLGAGELFVVEAEEVEIFTLARHETRSHALALKSQHHYDVGVDQAFPHRGVDFDPEPLDARGKKG